MFTARLAAALIGKLGNPQAGAAELNHTCERLFWAWNALTTHDRKGEPLFRELALSHWSPGEQALYVAMRLDGLGDGPAKELIESMRSR